MAVVILGGGFGLYGYLPAVLMDPNAAVVLPARYRPRIDARPELAPLCSRIVWRASDEAALEIGNRLIMARRPADQTTVPSLLAAHPNIRSVVLEKPLACSPSAADEVTDSIVALKRSLRVGYTVARTVWAQALLHALHAPTPPTTLEIAWSFRAHHLVHNRSTWKRHPAEGGGVLRFYGIQLLALLVREPKLRWTVELAADESAESLQPIRWHALLRNDRGTTARLFVDADSTERWCHVIMDDQTLWSGSSLFVPGIEPTIEDSRVRILAELLNEPELPDDVEWTRRVHELWSDIETFQDESSMK